MGDPPLVSPRVAEQLGTSHEEETPALEPDRRVIFAVHFGQDRQEGIPLPILAFQPGLGRFLVVIPADAPLPFDEQVPLSMEQQVVRWHDAACEEVARHPVVFTGILEGIGGAAMRKVVHEEFAARRKPAIDALELAPVSA